MRLTGLLVLSLLTTMVQAEVYRSVDKDGNVIFSDTPSPNSKRIRVAPVQTYSAPKPAQKVEKPATGAGAAPADAEKKPKKVVRYKLSIVSPKNDETVRQNAGNLNVTVSVKPGLQKGDLIQFSLNGKPFGKPTATTSTTMPFVDRGTHSIGAKIVTAGGRTKATASPVTVHLKRFFITN